MRAFPCQCGFASTTCRAHIARAAKAPISPRHGRPIQPMRLSETRGCAVGGSRAANALESSELSIERNAYRRKPQRIRKDWYWIGRAGRNCGAQTGRIPLLFELDATRGGTFLGDSYNDAPPSLRRARELALLIYRDTERARRKDAKTQAVQSEVATEQERLAAHSKAVLAAPVDGQLWTVQVSPG